MPKSRAQSRRATPFKLVCLEDRLAPATFTVTTTLDNGNDATPLVGSLRAAIVNANVTPGADEIVFAIPGAGVQTINPLTPLPPITEQVKINATTQTGFSGTPVVRLSGTQAGENANGLVLIGHSNSEIRGLTIGGFAKAGIRVEGGNAHAVYGNYLGLTPNGTASDGNLFGVVVTGEAKGVLIGGPSGNRNIISGNKTDGIRVEQASQAIISGNNIGTNVNGAAAIPNGAAGVTLASGAKGSIIGGFNAGEGNVIAGNVGAGVVLIDGATAGNTIAGNRIGLGFTGAPVPNGGDGVVALTGAGSTPVGGVTPTSNNVIQSNTISANKGNGISVQDSSRYLRIEGNAIWDNTLLGIVVAATANGGATAPTITQITPDISGPLIEGKLTGRPNTTYQLNFFTNTAQDPSGFGEGQFPQVVSVTTKTDGAGSATFSAVGPNGTTGSFLTATATATDTGETSSFSNAFVIPAAVQENKLFAVGAGAGGAPVVVVYLADGTEAYRITVFDASFTGGVRTAMADFNGDGVPDLVVGTGPGGPTRVRILDGKTSQPLFDEAAFEASFTGGVYVSAGDLNDDGVPELVISPDEGGGPRVRVLNGAANFTPIIDFFGIDDPNFRGGARTAIGDIDGSGVNDLIVAAGFGGGPRIAGFKGESLSTGTPVRVFADFFAFEQTLRNGVFIASGEFNGDGKWELVAGGGPGGGPRVTVFDGAALAKNTSLVPMANFFAGDPDNRGGVRLATRDLSSVGDGISELITGPGPGVGAIVNVYAGTDIASGTNLTPRVVVDAFAGFTGGVYVG